MKIIKSVWTLATYVAAFYTIKNQLETLSKAKDDFYNELTPEQREMYHRVFGVPGQTLQTFTMPTVSVKPPVSDIEHITAGT